MGSWMASETWLEPGLSRNTVVRGSGSGIFSATFHTSDPSSCSETAPCGTVPCGKGNWDGQGCTRPGQRSPCLFSHTYFPLLHPLSLTGMNKASWRLLQSTKSSGLGMVLILYWRAVWKVKEGVGNKGCEPGACDTLGCGSLVHTALYACK